MAHLEINARWQDLDVVLDGREVRVPYVPTVVVGVPLAPELLEPTLRYAAGVELALMLEIPGRRVQSEHQRRHFRLGTPR